MAEPYDTIASLIDVQIANTTTMVEAINIACLDVASNEDVAEFLEEVRDTLDQIKMCKMLLVEYAAFLVM